MTRLRAPDRTVLGWIGGLIQDTEPGTVPLGTIEDGQNFFHAPQPSAQMRTRGGSRIMLTLHDDAGTPATLTNTLLLTAYTPLGAIAVGWSDGRDRHYAYRLTADMAFATGVEATSRIDLSAAPSTSWNNATAPGRPVAAELYEKLFLADAITTYASRNEFLSLSSAGVVLRPQFSFDGGAASSIRPYCLEEYNGVLFIAGYGDAGSTDRPEMLRHSYLARSPDDTGVGVEGFDKNAYLLLGAKGQRITALRKGKGLLLAAKVNEFYRISGFGRAYPGWQYTVEAVENTTGLGIANPHGLCYAEGYWYGIGVQGPIRTDGFSIESLVGPRQRGWRAMRYPEFAAVSYHPDRRMVMFAMRPTQTETGHATTYPWVFWTWDIDRERWAPDHRFSTLNVSSFAPIPVPIGTAGGVLGPLAAPTSPVSSAATISGYTASWTNGDATAQTEFWEKEGSGGTWMLYATIAAGTATYARTGRTNHTQYYWKVRHVKSGITTDYATETGAQTLISPPFLIVSSLNVGTHSTDSGVVSLVVERSPTGAGTWTVQTTFTLVEALGVRDLAKAAPTFDWRAKATVAGWTVTDSVYSSTVNG